MAHAILIAVLAVGVASRVKPLVRFISLNPPRAVAVPAFPVPERMPVRARGAVGRPIPRAPAATARAAPSAIGHPDSVSVARRPAPMGPIIAAPRLADARIWPMARPALPAEVAEALYDRPDTVRRDTVAVHRLRVMVDSLNVVIDEQQREHRLPSWTTDVAGKKFGIDSSGIYVAGVKIPTAALALLGNMLPQGNFDESLRARQMEDMRQDLLQAARRTQTLQEFRRYVHELRERKQSERDAERRSRDTTRARRDTARAVP